MSSIENTNAAANIKEQHRKNPHGISYLELLRAKRTIGEGYIPPSLADWAHLVVQPDDIKQDDPIPPRGCIFLGPQQSAGKYKLDALRSASPPVGAIVNCTNAFPNHHEGDSITYCRVAINDEAGANILVYLDGTTEFIHHYIEKGISVLVHCQMGASRSSTVVIAYLMKYRSMSREEAYNHIKERRPQVNPNAGFWRQLQLYGQRLCQNEDSKKNLLKKEEIQFDKHWAETSLALFQTIGHIADDNIELFPEVNSACDFEKIIFAALDFVFGRGVLPSDLSWLGALCDVFGSLGVDPVSLIDKLFLDGSVFMELWYGEVSEESIVSVRNIANVRCLIPGGSNRRKENN